MFKRVGLYDASGLGRVQKLRGGAQARAAHEELHEHVGEPRDLVRLGSCSSSSSC